MAHKVCCYRCGASLAQLSLPLSRQDQCPDCGMYLGTRLSGEALPVVAVVKERRHSHHREDDADEVQEKERLNFCEWFLASESAFDPGRKAEEDAARAALDALFDD